METLKKEVDHDHQTNMTVEEKIEKVSDFLLRMMKFLKIGVASPDQLRRQSERIVFNKIRLGKKVDDRNPKFVNKTAKVHFYLKDISARLPDQDHILFLICSRLAENFEKYLEKEQPQVNLNDQKVQTFLKFIFTRFRNQLGGEARSIKSSMPQKKEEEISKIVESNTKKIKEKISGKKENLLEGILENLVNWTNNVTDYKNFSEKNLENIKKKK